MVWAPGRLTLEVSGTSDWEEIQGQTQNMLEGLHISPGLGTLWDPSGGADEHCWGERCLGFIAQPWISGWKWMDM